MKFATVFLSSILSAFTIAELVHLPDVIIPKDPNYKQPPSSFAKFDAKKQAAHQCATQNVLNALPNGFASTSRRLKNDYYTSPAVLSNLTAAETVNAPIHKEVQVYLNIMHLENGEGNYDDQVFWKQIDLLNAHFQGTGFTFNWVGVRRIQDNGYYYNLQAGSDAEKQMKETFYMGDKKVLNFYTGNFAQYNGWATFPHDYNYWQKRDGVCLHRDVLPGGKRENYNNGITGVHEVGHWLGLYHTFQNGCNPPGDEIDSTPPNPDPTHNDPNFFNTNGCPRNRDSCIGGIKVDVSNIMDYSWCRDHFNTDQLQRTMDVWWATRGA
ncbi:hypothetical protein HDU92_000150 [Lobulomyces angularis]|nr:hypothetical protein HDU92_000150 [Lobulomyces angularis]